MLLPKYQEWVDRLIAECQSSPDLTQWWTIGNQMHTLTDDYKIFYDYLAVKLELDAMWQEWLKAEPGKPNAAS